jgi:hypothetical protein
LDASDAGFCLFNSIKKWFCLRYRQTGKVSTWPKNGKKTGQICWREKHSVSDLELSSLAGFFAFIWSNLCTRNIQKKITPRGHQDWPDKRATRGCANGALIVSSHPNTVKGKPARQSVLYLVAVVICTGRRAFNKRDYEPEPRVPS